jgi:hypothetical protein
VPSIEGTDCETGNQKGGKMATFRILLADENETEVSNIVADLDAAINELGLLGGNFLVEKISENESEFWQEWSNRATS